MTCSWCGKEITDKEVGKAFTFTHEDGSQEHVHGGECEKEFENSRGIK